MQENNFIATDAWMFLLIWYDAIKKKKKKETKKR